VPYITLSVDYLNGWKELQLYLALDTVLWDLTSLRVHLSVYVVDEAVPLFVACFRDRSSGIHNFSTRMMKKPGVVLLHTTDVILLTDRTLQYEVDKFGCAPAGSSFSACAYPEGDVLLHEF